METCQSHEEDDEEDDEAKEDDGEARSGPAT